MEALPHSEVWLVVPVMLIRALPGHQTILRICRPQGEGTEVDREVDRDPGLAVRVVAATLRPPVTTAGRVIMQPNTVPCGTSHALAVTGKDIQHGCAHA